MKIIGVILWIAGAAIVALCLLLAGCTSRYDIEDKTYNLIMVENDVGKLLDGRITYNAVFVEE